MADRFEQLKSKYESVLHFMQTQNVQLQNLNMEGDKLFIRATAPSQQVKNHVWDQIKLVDPSYSDLIADIQAPGGSTRYGGRFQLATANGTSGCGLERSGRSHQLSPHLYGAAG